MAPLHPEIEKNCPACGRSVIIIPNSKQILHEWPVCTEFAEKIREYNGEEVGPTVVYKPEEGEPTS